MRELERVILLKNVDAKWMDHIDAMEDLKKGIYLRSYAQRDPVIEFRMESGEMFNPDGGYDPGGYHQDAAHRAGARNRYTEWCSSAVCRRRFPPGGVG